MSDDFEGADDSGVITVTVDGSGQVADVRIPATWQDTVHPRELGPALRIAANNALTHWLADRFEHADLSPEEPAAVARRDARDAGGDPSSQVAQDLVNEVVELLARFDRDLRSYRERLTEAAHTVAETRGVNGKIEVTMTAGHVSDVTVDVGWATFARYTEVRAEALGALQAAGRETAAADVAAVRPPPSIARLQELAADPAALSKQLGLS
ncbi:MAG TPA: hypothetical protein VFV67_12485 [Actinophytocola sp.]|uniref:hypothetical protein n=1 Tax=Actinophytocola sp. TaxID=1872138 RepID=UPI002DBB849D|nr:hypothetical protein [Actinophytocola sp.]HEU5471464.1 hypothetical protein [Actinophytocola sp.]